MDRSRREFLSRLGIGAGAALLPASVFPFGETHQEIKQVVAAWPFMNAGPGWTAEAFIENIRTLNISGVELFPVEKWDLLKKHGLVCAATKSHTFIRGMNNKNHHAECLNALEMAIEVTSAAGFPNVMTFTGLSDTSGEKGGSRVTQEEGMKNCIEGYKQIVGLAEKKNVTLVLEPLNTRYAENMKGHPGYLGDHIEYCMEIIKAVGSPALKLLFDVYHIQIMDGNIIGNIHTYREYIGHVQVAGVPGRGEIGAMQEINYPAVIHAFKETGYKGYIGHEWIPTGDPMDGLKEAVNICRS